jgi:hypothetical protein
LVRKEIREIEFSHGIHILTKLSTSKNIVQSIKEMIRRQWNHKTHVRTHFVSSTRKQTILNMLAHITRTSIQRSTTFAPRSVQSIRCFGKSTSSCGRPRKDQSESASDESSYDKAYDRSDRYGQFRIRIA